MSSRPKIAFIIRSDTKSAATWAVMNPVITMFHRFGLDVDLVDHSRISTVSGIIDNDPVVESRYIGALVVRATPALDTHKAFLSASHPWPIITWDSSAAVDSGAFKTGMASIATYQGGIQCLLSSPWGSIPSFGHYYWGVKSADWAINTVYAINGEVYQGGGSVEYTELIIDNSGAGGSSLGSLVAWRRNDPAGADVCYVTSSGSSWGDPIVFFGCLCYYLGTMVGYTPPRPLTLQIDIDDVESCTGSEGIQIAHPEYPYGTCEHCLDRFAARMRLNNTVCVAGISRYTGDNGVYTTPVIALEGTSKAIASVVKANTDVYKLIVHDHNFDILYFGNDNNYGTYPGLGIAYDARTVAGKIAIANANLAQCRKYWGDTVGHHYEGYFYLPMNALTPKGAQAMTALGGKKFRIGPTFVAVPYAVSGRGWSKIVSADAAKLNCELDIVNYTTEGGSSEITWAYFNGGSSTAAISRVIYLIVAFLKTGQPAIMMSHGANYALDPAIGNKAPIEKWMDEYLCPLMDMCGEDFFRFARKNEIGRL